MSLSSLYNFGKSYRDINKKDDGISYSITCDVNEDIARSFSVMFAVNVVDYTSTKAKRPIMVAVYTRHSFITRKPFLLTTCQPVTDRKTFLS